ncbi:hypothetical protein [Aquimarina algiphila]|uniref:hypothetical protein n=1 Tax=Aquimarina algiphila TaxID=2047982 RepID=UPI00232D5852|nr:hypothetical protein [Aquimarina algiphila]
MEKNILKKIFLTIIVITITISCQEDPFEDTVSNDRQFLSFTIPGQVGPAVIRPTGDNEGTVEIFAVLSNVDLSNIIPVLSISEYAQVSPGNGDIVNFNNDDLSITYQVISASGKVRNWVVKITPYESAIEGKWNVDKILYDWQVGINQTWGYGVFGTYDEITGYDPEAYVPEVFSKDFPNVAFEEDNTIEFITNQINENGNPEGTFSFGAGADNEFSSFILDPDRTGVARDYSARFRKIHQGDGVWEFNEGTKTLTLWKGSKAGAKTEGIVSTDDLGNIRIAYNTWEDDFPDDPNDGEAHIQTAITLYYHFIK